MPAGGAVQLITLLVFYYTIKMEISKQVLINNMKPDIWSLANIIPILKSGALSKPDNYLGISLTCVIAKMYNLMILKQVRDAINPHLRDNQNDFRKTKDHCRPDPGLKENH